MSIVVLTTPSYLYEFGGKRVAFLKSSSVDSRAGANDVFGLVIKLPAPEFSDTLQMVSEFARRTNNPKVCGARHSEARFYGLLSFLLHIND